MIYVNSEWGRQLSASQTAAIYRVQGNGKVRMSTIRKVFKTLIL